jgi:hypothetical protein
MHINYMGPLGSTHNISQNQGNNSFLPDNIADLQNFTIIKLKMKLNKNIRPLN